MLKKNLVTRLRYASENVATAKTMPGVCVLNTQLGYDCERAGRTMDECSKQCLARMVLKLADEVELEFAGGGCAAVYTPNVWGFHNVYCGKCGELLNCVANGLDECIPSVCPECGCPVMTR